MSRELEGIIFWQERDKEHAGTLAEYVDKFKGCIGLEEQLELWGKVLAHLDARRQGFWSGGVRPPFTELVNGASENRTQMLSGSQSKKSTG